jgi:phosphate acyltransferase
VTNVTVALDAMGGDHGASVVVPAAALACEKHPDLSLILVGDEAMLRQCCQQHGIDKHLRISIHHAAQIVAMDELPSQALRYKKDSSMRVAINLVKNGTAAACVSAGNTGALMATARFVLRMLPGIDRPAITATLPTSKKGLDIRMLDLGANVDSSCQELFQFAVMGAVLAEEVDNIPNPKIALLNIGEEEIKGNEQVKQTAQLLNNSPLNYCGYVEADKLFFAPADVVICDGFVGNVALKASEGAARVIASFIKQGFLRNWFTRLAGFFAMPVLTKLKERIDPAGYNGASLVGLQGIVVKSHGGASVKGFLNAIEHAMIQAKHNVPQKIREQVEQILQRSEAQQKE